VLKTRNGESLRAEFPDLPHTVTGGFPGTIGVVSERNHNIYEDYPVIGVAFEACAMRARIINGTDYESAVAIINRVAFAGQRHIELSAQFTSFLKGEDRDSGFDSTHVIVANNLFRYKKWLAKKILDEGGIDQGTVP